MSNTSQTFSVHPSCAISSDSTADPPMSVVGHALVGQMISPVLKFAERALTRRGRIGCHDQHPAGRLPSEKRWCCQSPGPAPGAAEAVERRYPDQRMKETIPPIVRGHAPHDDRFGLVPSPRARSTGARNTRRHRGPRAVNFQGIEHVLRRRRCGRRAVERIGIPVEQLAQHPLFVKTAAGLVAAWAAGPRIRGVGGLGTRTRCRRVRGGRAIWRCSGDGDTTRTRSDWRARSGSAADRCSARRRYDCDDRPPRPARCRCQQGRKARPHGGEDPRPASGVGPQPRRRRIGRPASFHRVGVRLLPGDEPAPRAGRRCSSGTSRRAWSRRLANLARCPSERGFRLASIARRRHRPSDQAGCSAQRRLPTA